ncbi:hypothetical protein D3C80_1983220 [compost metagenome]
MGKYLEHFLLLHDTHYFSLLPTDLRNDKELALIALSNCPWNFEYLPDSLKLEHLSLLL